MGFGDSLTPLEGFFERNTSRTTGMTPVRLLLPQRRGLREERANARESKDIREDSG